MTTAASHHGHGDNWTILSIRQALNEKRISARELTTEFLARIEKRNPELNAFLTVSPERAYKQADRIDACLAAGAASASRSPDCRSPSRTSSPPGQPGLRTTCASRMLENHKPPYNATAVERLEEYGGAIVLGKTNCDEFAMGGSNENSAYGPVRNPVALDRVPGGSSGGSAAAVAADLAVASLGTDTGGSIRQPAAFCGITGLMPTYGRVSRYGLIAFASSLDRIGPFARTVRDAASIMNVMAGRDAHDSTSADVRVPNYILDLDKPVKDLRIGVPTDYFGAGLDPAVREKVEAGIALLGETSAAVAWIPVHAAHRLCGSHLLPDRYRRGQLHPPADDCVCYGLRVPGTTPGKMYRNTRGSGFAEVKRRIMLGTGKAGPRRPPTRDYLKAQKVRALSEVISPKPSSRPT